MIGHLPVKIAPRNVPYLSVSKVFQWKNINSF